MRKKKGLVGKLKLIIKFGDQFNYLLSKEREENMSLRTRVIVLSAFFFANDS